MLHDGQKMNRRRSSETERFCFARFFCFLMFFLDVLEMY